MNSFPLHFQDLWFPLMFVLTVCFLYEGCSQGWMSQSTRALPSLPGLSLLELISAPHLPKDAVLRESSPCAAAPRDQHVPDSRDCEEAAGFLYTFALAVLLTWSPETDQT